MRSVRNVAALSKFNNLSLPILFFDYSESCIGEVHIALGTSLKTSSPPNHVDKTTLITVRVGYAKGVDKAMFEGCEGYAQGRIECCVESQGTVKVIVRVVEREPNVFGE